MSFQRNGETVFQFADQHGPTASILEFRLLANKAGGATPELRLISSTDADLEIVDVSDSGELLVRLTVPPSLEDAAEEELDFQVCGDGDCGIEPFKVELRRTSCSISTGLIQRESDSLRLRPACKAALLWHACGRYREIVGLKRFTSGKSGSDVLVFRPRLRDPVKAPPGSVVPGVVEQVWGSCLLVKTGAEHKVREEWDRYQTFLVDRLHPFMSRSEEFLTVLPCGEGTYSSDAPQATVIGSFLGGDLLQAETFQQLVQGGYDVERCIATVDKLFGVMDTWYQGATERPLREWHKVFRGFKDDEPLRLFGRFDFQDEQQRKHYRTPLAWDIAFGQKEHLRDHLLGKGDARDGLLYQIMQWSVRYSLVHGDLHTGNILADSENVWLLDFGETGIAPTLFDFAKLELYLRMWCLRLRPRAANFDDAAYKLEQLMLDHLTGSDASLEPVREIAAELGADPEELLQIAHCICHIRRHALRYTLGTPDCRDYLAVLFLNVLDATRFAGTDPKLAQNFRLLLCLAWTLEDVLSRIAGMEPYNRMRMPFDQKKLVTREWVVPHGAPGRITYLLGSDNDRNALEPLAATQGVHQNPNHHLDVFDHTLLLLGYLEHLIQDPLGGLIDPAGLDQRVHADLERQGIRLPSVAYPLSDGQRPDLSYLEPWLDEIRQHFEASINPQTIEVLKWSAVFHDVGKSATRVVNRKGARAAETEATGIVQFLGHEVYGLQLIQDHLTSLFPHHTDQTEREWISFLVLKHHRHHDYISRYSPGYNEGDADREHHEQIITAFRAALDTHELPQRESDYLSTQFAEAEAIHPNAFVSLILHGYADVMACRGVASSDGTGVLRVAATDLLLLALHAQQPAIAARREAINRAKELTKGLGEAIGLPQGKELGEVIKATQARIVDQLLRPETSDSPPPNRNDVVATARGIKAQLANQSADSAS